MSRQAQLYVLDEPIAGVDPAARDYILRAIINNYNPEATVIISTHLISDVEKVLTAAYNKNTFAYDQENKEFVLIKEGEEPAQTERYRYFKMVSSQAELDKENNAGYSCYLKEAYEGEAVTTKGLDVGENTDVSSVVYSNPGSAQNVVIRTNNMFGKLTISAINDEVDHYGDIGDLDIIAVKKGTYDEFGRVGGIAKLTYGAISVHDDAEVTTILVTPANDNKSDVKLTVKNGGVVGTLIAPTDEILTELATEGVNHSEVLVLQEGESTVEEAIERTLGSVAYVSHEDTSRTYYESFDEACNKAATNETVVVLKDYQYKDEVIGDYLITIAKDKKVTIDLNGKIVNGVISNKKSNAIIKIIGEFISEFLEFTIN